MVTVECTPKGPLKTTLGTLTLHPAEPVAGTQALPESIFRVEEPMSELLWTIVQLVLLASEDYPRSDL